MTKFLIFAVLIILLWGFWGIASKISIGRIGMQALFWSVIIGDLFLVLYLLLSNQMLPLKTDKAGIFIALLGGVAGTIALILVYLLLIDYPVGIVVPVTALNIVVTVILGMIILKEKISPENWVGIALAMISIYLLSR